MVARWHKYPWVNFACLITNQSLYLRICLNLFAFLCLTSFAPSGMWRQEPHSLDVNLLIEEHCDFRNVKFHKAIYVGNVSDVWAGLSVNPCVFQGTTILPLQSVSYFNVFQPSTLKMQDFKIGIFGARRAPRALAWWDLRKAYVARWRWHRKSEDLIAKRNIKPKHTIWWSSIQSEHEVRCVFGSQNCHTYHI